MRRVGARQGMDHHDRARSDPSRRFELLRLLGQGDMGAVHLARDRLLERSVALKRVVALDERAAEQARREIRCLARVRHPNVVALLDAGRGEVHRSSLAEQFDSQDELERDDLDGVGRATLESGPGEPFWLAMDYVPGESLRAWIDRGPHPWSTVLARLLPLGEGLAAVHRAGVLHRDVKPDNVLLDEDGRAVLIDFGLARRLDEPDDGDERAGTVAYLAPEALLGHSRDARADQFSYCSLLFEALVGHRPFADRTATLRGELRPVPRGKVANRPAIPRALITTLIRGLAPTPEQRFADVDALVSALHDAVDHHHGARRRGIQRLSIGSSLIFAGLLGLWFGHPRPADQASACERDTAAIDRVWSDEQRGRVASRIRPDDLALLDDWARRWRVASERSCTDEDDQTLAEVARLARRRCLLGQLAEFETTLGWLASREPTAADRAGEVGFAGLPIPERCLELGRDSLDSISSARLDEQVHTLTKLLADDQIDEARALATELRDTTAGLGGAPRHRAEALRALAVIARSEGDLAGATRQLDAAVTAAVQANDDGLFASLLIERVALEGELGRFEGLAAEAALAAVMLAQTGSSTLELAELRRTEGEALIRWPERRALGITRLHEALALLESTPRESKGRSGDPAFELARAHTHAALGRAELLDDRPEQAREHLEAALDTFSVRLRRDHRARLDTERALALAEIATGSSDVALDRHMRMIMGLDRRFGRDDRRIADACFEASEALREVGQIAEAQTRMAEGIARLETIAEVDSEQLNYYYRSIATLLRELGDEYAANDYERRIRVHGG